MHDSYAESQKKITRESIVTALVKLLEKHPFSAITITQITTLAGVSRMAFYRNYNTKEEIIAVYLDEMVDEFYCSFTDLAQATKYDILCGFFAFFKSRKRFIEILIKADLLYIFNQRLNAALLAFFKTIDEKNKPEYGTYLARFDAGGLYNVLIEWLSNGTPESIETMAKLICEFTC
jgi:AcrR family transcriptional regulator